MLCLSLLVIVVDTTIVNVALPTFARDLHASSSGLQWIVDAYTLTFAALLLLAGAIADRYGRHRALAFGLGLFAFGSLAAALTQTTSELIAARAVMGVGGAFIMPATLSIITAVFTDHAERTRAIGLVMLAAGMVFFATASGSSGYGHYVLAMVIDSAGIGLAMSAATSASMRELPPAMAGVGSAVNDTTRNMGSVLGVAVFGSIAASVFAGRMGGLSLGAAAAAGHRAGGTSGASVLHAAADAFVSGADRAVLAGAIVVAAGLVVAFRAFRPARALTPAQVPAQVPAEAQAPVLAGTRR
ncbi:MAG TPA: MFS transporter [Streptosporangiaceae bacterium]|nr:MFS transporter [Streptosporangiaceae bacterium]